MLYTCDCRRAHNAGDKRMHRMWSNCVVDFDHFRQQQYSTVRMVMRAVENGSHFHLPSAFNRSAYMFGYHLKRHYATFQLSK